jgi:hypothetical protein
MIRSLADRGTTEFFMVRPTHQSTARDLRLAEIRRQIAAGTYETPDKLSAALDAFLDQQSQDDQPDDLADKPKAPRPR